MNGEEGEEFLRKERNRGGEEKEACPRGLAHYKCGTGGEKNLEDNAGRRVEVE